MTMTSRLSKTELIRLADRLSKRDWQIIRFIDQHRYATTVQLRRMLFTAAKPRARALDRGPREDEEAPLWLCRCPLAEAAAP